MDAVAAMVVETKREAAAPLTYCVTGATGYIGSWLVKILLERGYKVHATVRNPEKARHLLSKWSDVDRLSLFRADMEEEGSFDDAVRGCDGVFHVAASMQFDVPPNENQEAYVQLSIIEPAIRGTKNILKSCLKSNSVKKVVLTSSISTMTARNNGGWRQIVDESCQTHIDPVCSTKLSGWVYVLSKLLTEEAAFKFASDNGIDLVSVITTTVAGLFLTSSVPSSIQVLLSPITGDPMFSSILSTVNARMGSIALVHIEDICSAHIFLMRHENAEGKYICCVSSCSISELVSLLAQDYPSTNVQRLKLDQQDSIPCEISSRKLRDLGFAFKYSIEDIIHQTISACEDHGFLPPMKR